MKLKLFFLPFCCALLLTTACSDDDNDALCPPTQTFNALWSVVNERYCFFDDKQQEFGLDWNAVREKYQPRVDNGMTQAQLFEVMAQMLGELRDGHVNLSATHDFSRYWAWKENHPANVSDSLLRRYLGTDYKIASGMKYRILDDNIGYLRYESFNDALGEGNLDEVFAHLIMCRGLILDLRSNGGGLLNYAERLAARFCQKATVVGYMRHKTGKGHNDFSAFKAITLHPSSNIGWAKPVVVLTNRGVFSAANQFVAYMKALPGVTILGDVTGGGGGMPFTDTLPNGWTVRFSAVPTYDADHQSIEQGIAPDIRVDLDPQDELRGIDTLIERARLEIKN